jgi:predicted phage terminase large subunit-like protein
MDADGVLHVVDVRVGRWDALEIINEMFSINEAWHPDEWYLESGSILKTLQGALEVEQRKRNTYLPMSLMVPVNDKSRRSVSIQARMRARAVRFDKDTSWYAHLEEECLNFPRGDHDDYVDALAWLGVGLARMVTPLTDDEAEEEDFEFRKREAMTFGASGRSLWTGY